MAHNVTLANAARNAVADAVAALCDGGVLRVYDGIQPAGPGTAVTTQTLLAECTFADPAFSSAVAGVATAHTIADDPAADASGTATWFRIVGAGGSAVIDGTVGVGASFDCDVPTAVVVAGEAFSVSSLTLTAPAS